MFYALPKLDSVFKVFYEKNFQNFSPINTNGKAKMTLLVALIWSLFKYRLNAHNFGVQSNPSIPAHMENLYYFAGAIVWNVLW